MLIPLLLGVGLLAGGQANAADQAPVTCEAKNPKPQDTTISFDTKGVEFGSWVRRFINRVRRNWLVPEQALAFRGCVTISFRVLKDGTLAETTVVSASEIVQFTEASRNALTKSAPFESLPAAYPDASATMTVTFYYNESPPSTPTLDKTPLVSGTTLFAPPPPDFASQPEPTAPPTRAHGHSVTFRLAGTGTSDPIDLLRWFATGKAGATGLWLVEHQHADAPGSAYCRGSLALAGDHLVFRSENLSEGFVATADQITTVNRRPGSQSFTISFR